MTCPCGGPSLEECCGPFLSGERLPETAEALMRSRYTAYTREEIDYIVNTHHPRGREDVDRAQTETWAKEAEWSGLEIVSTQRGGPGDSEGEVEFIARYTVKDAEFSHHERSTFRREDDRWFYLDGAMIKPRPVVREAPKVGRNEPCPCGSGKKFKKCHGVAA
jgi:SEC-C motif domain protein